MSYGTDVWALGPLRTGRLASGVTLLAQAAYRRLMTPRGTLRGGPDAEIYGFDLASYVGSLGSTIAAAALPSRIEAELTKDDRIAAVATTVAVDARPNGQDLLTVEITITPADETDPFTLTLAVDAVDVTVLGVPS